MTQKVPIAMKMLLNQHAVIGGGNKSSAHQYTHTHTRSSTNLYIETDHMYHSLDII